MFELTSKIKIYAFFVSFMNTQTEMLTNDIDDQSFCLFVKHKTTSTIMSGREYNRKYNFQVHPSLFTTRRKHLSIRKSQNPLFSDMMSRGFQQLFIIVVHNYSLASSVSLNISSTQNSWEAETIGRFSGLGATPELTTTITTTTTMQVKECVVSELDVSIDIE